MTHQCWQLKIFRVDTLRMVMVVEPELIRVMVVVYVATSMFQNGRPFGNAKRKQAVTRGRKLFSENAQFKPFCVQQRLHW